VATLPVEGNDLIDTVAESADEGATTFRDRGDHEI
jgi:hypothetical protein